MPLLLIPEYSGINKEQRIPDRSKTAHRKPPVKCILTSPQATLLTGLGPRPSSSLSWPLPWGCSTEKAPTGGPCCNPSSRMGAAPHSGQLLFHSRIPLLLSYNHQSHTTTTALHTMTTALTHTALTHHSHTHRSHTMTAALTL